MIALRIFKQSWPGILVGSLCRNFYVCSIEHYQISPHQFSKEFRIITYLFHVTLLILASGLGQKVYALHMRC